MLWSTLLQARKTVLTNSNAKGYIAIFSQHIARFQICSNTVMLDLQILDRITEMWGWKGCQKALTTPQDKIIMF